MHSIHYKILDKEIVVESDETILETSLRNDIPHAHACGGNARCSSCRVIVSEGLENCALRNEKEQELADKLGFKDHIRLACQTKVKNGKIAIRLPVMDEIDIRIVSSRGNQRGMSSIGEERNMTMLFADIEGYTSFTEVSQPYDVVHVLNRYYFLMGKIVQKYNGYIMDYFGDGFLAVFGLENDTSHAEDAIQAGLEMTKALGDLNTYIKALVDKQLAIRIGINTDTVIVGTIGVDNMRKLAAIGDGVNLAARIEAANKQLGTYFLIADSTFQEIKDQFPFKASHQIEVKGKSGSYTVHELEFV